MQLSIALVASVLLWSFCCCFLALPSGLAVNTLNSNHVCPPLCSQIIADTVKLLVNKPLQSVPHECFLCSAPLMQVQVKRKIRITHGTLER